MAKLNTKHIEVAYERRGVRSALRLLAGDGSVFIFKHSFHGKLLGALVFFRAVNPDNLWAVEGLLPDKPPRSTWSLDCDKHTAADLFLELVNTGKMPNPYKN